jgi:hypothetical protein
MSKNWKKIIVGTSSSILWEVLVKSSHTQILPAGSFFMKRERPNTLFELWNSIITLYFDVYVYTTHQWLNKVSS